LAAFGSGVCDWVDGAGVEDGVSADVGEKEVGDNGTVESDGTAEAADGRHSRSSILMQMGSDFVGSMSRVWMEMVGWGVIMLMVWGARLRGTGEII
jgi:hypothetical protein